MNASARRIADAVLNALQDADEIGGVDSHRDYIELMDYIAQECRKRAETAEANEPRRLVLTWFQEHGHPAASIIETGGGCTAIYIPVRNDGSHWLVTDDAEAPGSTVSPMTLGFYDGDGSYWLTFNCRDAAHCVDIMRSMDSYSI